MPLDCIWLPKTVQIAGYFRPSRTIGEIVHTPYHMGTFPYLPDDTLCEFTSQFTRLSRFD